MTNKIFMVTFIKLCNCIAENGYDLVIKIYFPFNKVDD